MSTTRTTMLAAVAIGAVIASTAFAQGMGPGNCMGRGGMGQGGMGCGMMGRGMGPVARLCAKDIETHCANTQRGPAMRSCLEAKKSELTENCRIALNTTGPNHGPGTGPVAHLCVNEISRFCPQVEHVNGQVRTCLEQHKAELGEACVTALDTTGCRWKR